MSRIDDFNLNQEAIMAIPNENVKEPVIPMSVYNQEADDLYTWALIDKEKLALIGITEEMISDLLPRVGACRHAQAEWMTEYETSQQAEKDWKEQAPDAFNLRNELVHDFYYAFRNDDDLLKNVENIAEGSSNADMVQDLYDLAILGRPNSRYLQAVNFDLTKLDTAEQLSEQLARILSLANGAKITNSEKKEVRDRAYTHLKELVDEIRKAGKYLYWKDEKKLRGYRSHYWKNQNTKKNKNDTDE